MTFKALEYWHLPPSVSPPAPSHPSPHVRTGQVVSCRSPGPLCILFPLSGSFYTVMASTFSSSDGSLEVSSSEKLSRLKLDAHAPHPHSHHCLSMLFPFGTYSSISITYFSYFWICFFYCFLIEYKLPKERDYIFCSLLYPLCWVRCLAHPCYTVVVCWLWVDGWMDK